MPNTPTFYMWRCSIKNSSRVVISMNYVIIPIAISLQGPEMKSIWFNKDVTLERISAFNKDTIMEALDIEYTELGPDYLSGTLPVSTKTVQPHKKLHGGASCVLAETLGSVASNLVIDQTTTFAVGQHISTQHLRPGNLGETMIGKATVIHLGSKTHLWNIDITNHEGKLISTTRLTMAIVKK